MVELRYLKAILSFFSLFLATTLNILIYVATVHKPFGASRLYILRFLLSISGCQWMNSFFSCHFLIWHIIFTPTAFVLNSYKLERSITHLKVTEETWNTTSFNFLSLQIFLVDVTLYVSYTSYGIWNTQEQPPLSAKYRRNLRDASSHSYIRL